MPDVRTIAVIGAGPVGRGIAQAAVLAGYRTILEDILPASLRRAEAEIRGYLAGADAVPQVEAEAALRRLEYASTVEEAAREADLVIEVVPEEMESKIEIFTLLDRICKPGTMLASNTWSLSVSEIASVTYRAKKIIGTQFSDPVHAMKSLSLVRATETDDETVAACSTVARRMGKEVVVINEQN
ncbi:MAG TPA: 3-hydroxyacyl-CoA dehydrogenase NAD-binding domain-containing protein [Candidatus Angelobacter sp.]|nr:3-hydroxyacyl-CoA dehydrogenase NAD-binding domain-containing protein [Candidatus Angelobacter sp.]